MEEDKLTPVERIFVEEYLANGFVASKAYEVSHPDAPIKNSRNLGYRYRNTPAVAEEISRRLQEMIGTKQDLANEAMLKLKEMAFADKDDIYYVPAIQLKAIENILKQMGTPQETKSTIEITLVD